MAKLRSVTVGLALAVSLATASASGAKFDATRPRLEHSAVWVQNTDKAAAFLTGFLGWHRHPMHYGFGPGYGPDVKELGPMRLTFFDANGLWLEMVEPLGPGPGMDQLKAKGPGTIEELNVEVPNVDAEYDRLKAQGIRMLNMDGSPLDDAHKGFSLGPGRERIAYFPAQVSAGTIVELYQRVPGVTSILGKRDAMWKPSMRTPASAPRIDRVLLLSKNLERTARFYTEVLGFTRTPASPLPQGDSNVAGEAISTRIDANGFAIEIIEPRGPGALANALAKRGDGYLMAYAAEVSDIEKCFDRMQGKGVTMVDLDDRPLPAGKKAVTLPGGERYHYFPLSVSDGLRIQLFQRSTAAQ